MAIADLPTPQSLGFTPQGGSARGYEDAAGNAVSRRAADNVRAQAVGFNSIREYNEARQAERVAYGQTSASQDRYAATGKDVAAVQAGQLKPFEYSSTTSTMTGMAGRQVPVSVDKVEYTGKEKPENVLNFDNRMYAKLDKVEDKILENAAGKVSRIVVEIDQGGGNTTYASSPYIDLGREIQRQGSLSAVVDSIANTGAYGASTSIVSVTTTSI